MAEAAVVEADGAAYNYPRMRSFLVIVFLIFCNSMAVSQQQATASAAGNPQNNETAHRIESVNVPNHDKSPADWWLVGFTAALFAAALLQFGAMWIHARTMHETLKETKTIAEAASTLARASASGNRVIRHLL